MGHFLLCLFLFILTNLNYVFSAPLNSTESSLATQDVTKLVTKNDILNLSPLPCSNLSSFHTEKKEISLSTESNKVKNSVGEFDESTTIPGILFSTLSTEETPNTLLKDTEAVFDFKETDPESENFPLNFRNEDLLTTTEVSSFTTEEEESKVTTVLPQSNDDDLKSGLSSLSEDEEEDAAKEEGDVARDEKEDIFTDFSSRKPSVESITTTELSHRVSDELQDHTSVTQKVPTDETGGITIPLAISEDGPIREISIILLPLEDREVRDDYEDDAEIDKVVSLFEIGGDSPEHHEIRNETSIIDATSNPLNENDTMDTVAFNAAKIREKLRTSTQASSSTKEEFIPTHLSSVEETTTPEVDELTSTTTVQSVTTENLQTTPTTMPSTETESDVYTNETLELKVTNIPTTTTTTTTEVITPLITSTQQSQQSTTFNPSIDEFSDIDDDRYISGNVTDTVAAVQFLHYHDKASSEQCYKLVNAHWNYATNLTEENKKKQLAQTLEYSQFHKEAWKNATSFSWKSFNDTLLRRWFKSLSVLGTAALSDETLTEYNKLKAEMKNIYSTAKICGYQNKPDSRRRRRICALSLEPDLQRIMTKSRNYDELIHIWKSWRDSAGKPIRKNYLKFVEISNQAAHLNGFQDTGDMWRESYESLTFREDLAKLWEQLRPLYEHLHAYVRRRLIGLYGNEKIKEDGPIPAHLFGNMWAQSWVSLLDITQPYPGKPTLDVTATMEAKNMTALEMFKISEEFFTSLGLKPMPEEFWKHSLIVKPKDREIICHASAWDFCNGRDYRIKQCTDITMQDLVTVHHEMGHIQYFLQYARQPNVFREGANPGFHEAIGDVLALSVSTPNHLKSIGLLEEVSDDPEGDLNFLFRIALEKVSFLPSGYLIDLWRWGLFSEEIKPEEMNKRWWDLRLKYQGICPPIKRTEEDFDPGAKYHVPGNVPYIRYFVSFIIQFQFHKVLCDAAGHTGPLHKCDVYRSNEAGQILSQVMELGSSEHWSEAMNIMTGGATSKMDASPILEYFEPLLNYLIEQNRNETIGWRSSDSTICP